MKSSILFKHTGPLIAAEYFMGHYRWTAAWQLSAATIILRPPSVGFVTIGLEVAGTLTGDVFQIGPSAVAEVRQTIALSRTIAIGNEVRWKVLSFTGANEEAATAASIVMQSGPADYTAALLPDAPLTVRWVNGVEDVLLYHYSAGIFTPVSVAMTLTRGTITVSGFGVEVLIGTDLVFEVDSTGARANSFNEMGALLSPRLEFYVGALRVAAAMTGGVFYVPSILESTPVAGGGQFEFTAGTLKAALGVEGLTAVGFTEPL